MILSLALLKHTQTLIIPTQEFATEPLNLVRLCSRQLRNNMPRLLRPQQPSLRLQARKLGPILITHLLVMHLPNLTLHLRVHHARPDGNGSHIRLFCAQRERNMIQDCFARAIRAPALVRCNRCARGG
jgi:hypothetical protein